MGVVVSFDYDTWVALYPELAYVNATQAQQYFYMATQPQANNGWGPINDPTRALMLLNLLTAHFAKLFAINPANPNSTGLVGRISDAAEGSVHGSIENKYAEGTVQWYQQTQYGSSWWALTSVYRRFRYIPGTVQPAAGPNFRGGPWFVRNNGN